MAERDYSGERSNVPLLEIIKTEVEAYRRHKDSCLVNLAAELEEVKNQAKSDQDKEEKIKRWFVDKTTELFGKLREQQEPISPEEEAKAWLLIGLAVENALGYFPHPAQFKAAKVMEQDDVAQVPTGGGKSEPILIMAALFKALCGRKVQVWTIKQDLVEIQSQEAAKVAKLLGVPLGFTREKGLGLDEKVRNLAELDLAMEIAGYSQLERERVKRRLVRDDDELAKLLEEEEHHAEVRWLAGPADGEVQPLMTAAEKLQGGVVLYSKREAVIFETLIDSLKKFKTNWSLVDGWSCLIDEIPYILFSSESMILATPDLCDWAKDVAALGLLKKVLDEMLEQEEERTGKKVWFKFLDQKATGRGRIPQGLTEEGMRQLALRVRKMFGLPVPEDEAGIEVETAIKDLESDWSAYLPPGLIQLVKGRLAQITEFGLEPREFLWDEVLSDLVGNRIWADCEEQDESEGYDLPPDNYRLPDEYWSMAAALIQAEGLVRGRDYRLVGEKIVLLDEFACLTSREYQSWLKPALMLKEGLLPEPASFGHTAMETALSFQKLFQSVGGCSANASEYEELIRLATEVLDAKGQVKRRGCRVIVCDAYFGESRRQNPEEKPVFLDPRVGPAEAIETKVEPILEEVLRAGRRDPVLVMFPTDEAGQEVKDLLDNWCRENGYQIQVIDALLSEAKVKEMIEKAGQPGVLTLATRRLEIGDNIKVKEGLTGWVIALNPSSEIQARGRMDRGNPCCCYFIYYLAGPGGIPDLAEKEGFPPELVKQISQFDTRRAWRTYQSNLVLQRRARIEGSTQQATIYRAIREELFPDFRSSLVMPEDLKGDFPEEDEYWWDNFIKPALRSAFDLILKDIAAAIREARFRPQDDDSTWVVNFGERFLKAQRKRITEVVKGARELWRKEMEQLRMKRLINLIAAKFYHANKAVELYELRPHQLLLVGYVFEGDVVRKKVVLIKNYDGTPERLLELLTKELKTSIDTNSEGWRKYFDKFREEGSAFWPIIEEESS